jgi:hypothetical protein
LRQKRWGQRRDSVSDVQSLLSSLHDKHLEAFHIHFGPGERSRGGRREGEKEGRRVSSTVIPSLNDKHFEALDVHLVIC